MGQALDEGSAAGDDFLAHVCQQWEAAAEPARPNLAVIRVGVVLGRDGGAFKKMRLPFKLGLGGPIAGGAQPFPWIHIADLCSMYTWLVTHPNLKGVFNGAAPESCDQGTFARGLGRALGRPAFAPVPGFVLSALLGERASLLTTGQQVTPRRATEAGFDFQFGELAPALADLVAS
jgi:hypothetical protein